MTTMLKQSMRWVWGALMLGGSFLAVPTLFATEPGSPNPMPTLQDLMDRLADGVVVDYGARPPFSDPPGPYPEGAMPTLADIMALMPAPHTNAATPMQVREGKVFWSLNTNTWGTVTGTVPVHVVSPDTNMLQAGFYDETVWSSIETNLQPHNLRMNKVLMGVTGTVAFVPLWPAAIPRTGATEMHSEGDDASYQAGEPWPNPRFVVGTGSSSNVVTDQLTGLMWIRQPLASYVNWVNARNAAEALDGGSGRGGYTDWRLPNVRELLSLIDFGRDDPALPTGHPFTIPSDGKWMISSTFAPHQHTTPTRRYYGVNLGSGRVFSLLQNVTFTSQVWAVRGAEL